MGEHDLNRRQFIKTVGVASVAAAAMSMPFIRASASDTRFAGKTLRLLTWSDDTGLAALRNIAATFEAKTGAKVIADRTGSTSEMVAKLKAGGDRPQYDIITLAGVAPKVWPLPDCWKTRSQPHSQSGRRPGKIPHRGQRSWHRLPAVVQQSGLQHPHPERSAGQLRRAVGRRSGTEHFPAAAELDRGDGPDHQSPTAHREAETAKAHRG